LAQAWASFTASWGSYPRARIERRWTGKGLAMVVALGRLLRVAGRSPKLRASSGGLGAVRGRQRGRWPCTRVGFIAAREHGTVVAQGRPRARAGVHVRTCSVTFSSVYPRRTRGGLLLPVFNGLFGRLSVQISAKIPCMVSSLHQILSFPCEFQAKIWSALRDIGVGSWLCPSCPHRDKNRVKSCQTT
jgi:hypothetical protein